MTAKTYLRSFAAGELSPQLFGRLDLGKFQTGVAKALNFIVTPQGPIDNRPGFAYVNKAKYENSRAALITRGLAEMTRIGVAMGANPLTFKGLGGVGDLFLAAGAVRHQDLAGVAVAEHRLEAGGDAANRASRNWRSSGSSSH